MWKRIISVLLITGFCTINAFAHDAAIEINGENKYQAVRLTPKIYNAANSDLSDILIKDSKDENVPYFINTGQQRSYENRETYQMELLESYTKDSRFYFDYKLIDERDSDTIATSIEFITKSTDFAKDVDVYGSHDNVNWKLVQNDKLYSVDDSTKLSIEFHKPEKYIYYRFGFSNNMEKISFTTVNLIYDTSTNEKTYFIENYTPKFRIEEKDKETCIEIDGLKNLRLCDITIESNSMFKRTASTPQGEYKEIYNLSLNEISYTDTTIPLDWKISKDEVFTVRIGNNDDKPIKIDGITVRFYVDEIVFEGNKDLTYRLEFGADAQKTAPVYDIARYKDEILKEPVDIALLGEISFEETVEVLPERDYRWIFNVVVLMVALLLGIVIVRRLKLKE